MPNEPASSLRELDGLMEMRAVRSRADLPMPAASLPVSKAVDVGLSGLW